MSRPVAAVIMAAGKGTRMNNPGVAKVMFPINGRPMIDYVVDLAEQIHCERIVVVVGWQKDSVIGHLKLRDEKVVCVEQSPQLGTGHAVMQAESSLSEFEGDVLVLSGDVPMLRSETVNALLTYHREHRVTATVLTAIVPDATGYGRVVRDDDGNVVAIVEHRDASGEQQAIKEINSGIYVFDRDRLFAGLKQITPNNDQKEYYLTDVFEYFWRNKYRVSAVPAGNSLEIQGINTLAQLEEARSVIGKTNRGES
jgi:UDP-N-acetylglucosamine pyrophosphorylase